MKRRAWSNFGGLPPQSITKAAEQRSYRRPKTNQRHVVLLHNTTNDAGYLRSTPLWLPKKRYDTCSAVVDAPTQNRKITPFRRPAKMCYLQQPSSASCNLHPQPTAELSVLLRLVQPTKSCRTHHYKLVANHTKRKRGLSATLAIEF